MNIHKRFWSKVRKTRDEKSCWEWTGCLTSDGYGHFGVAGRAVGAHRVAYTLTHHDFDESLEVCHHCDNRKCVRPDHLFLGTKRENWLDSVRKHRNPIAPGAEHFRAKLTEADVREIRNAYAIDQTTHVELAQRYGITRNTILKIVHNRIWPDPNYIPPAGDGRKLRKKFPLGSKHSQAKLTESDVLEIRRLHAAGILNQKELALQFDVCFGLISQIIRRKIWTHI